MTQGVRASASGFGKWKPSASTPTTVCGLSLRGRLVPTTSAFDPKRRLQAPWLSSTTRSASVRASASVKSRPSRGLARSNGNSAGETRAPLRVVAPSGPFQRKENAW